MNTHSLFGYLFIALFSLLVVSCYSTPDGVMSSLSQAEKIMESRPDSAMAILQHIPTPETLHGKAQADYSLLMTQAMDKNYINFTSDSLIKFAVGYYGGHTEDLVAKGKSFYYYGRVMESLDKVEDAMTFYLKAKDVLQSSDQFKLLGLIISEGIGTLNRKQKLFDTALNSYKESLTYYSLVPDSLCMTYANRNIGRVFLYKNRLDSAYYYYDKAIYISNANKYVAVGSLLLELGVIHRSEKDYIGAERYFLTFLEKEKTPNKLYSGYLALGNLYLYMNRFEDAEHFLMLCLDSPDPVVKRDACECLYDLEKESNKFKEAVIYKDIADSLRMMTQDIDTQNAIADLQGRYNNEKWQRESLQSSIEKKNILLISSFVGFIAVMVIIYIYYKYRTNQKLVKDINERIRKNDVDIKMYQRQILNYQDLQKETLQDYRNQIGELHGKMSVLEDQNKALSLRLTEKKHDIPESEADDLYAIYMQALHILIMLRGKNIENTSGKKLLLDADWDKLFHLSNAIHGDFITRIKNDFPTLTKHDIEICCLLRFGIEHEVLGSIFLTETDSVTKAKRRMKKRLNLSASDDLDVFLLKY